MNKALRLFNFLVLISAICSISSCKKQKISPVYYDVSKDVISPVIEPLSPVNNSYIIGHPSYVVNLVGTIKDDEVIGRGGQLASASLLLEELDTLIGVPIKTVLNVALPVDKLIVYGYNEKRFKAPYELGLHFYKVTLVAKDYASRSTTLSFVFTLDVQP